jgi:hypothetical protein
VNSKLQPRPINSNLPSVDQRIFQFF